MRTPMYLAGLFAVLLGCSADKVTDLGIVPSPHSGFFVSVDGSQTGDGSSTDPWTLATALAQPAVVKAGDTIWLRGGTYRGDFTSNLTGAPAAPIILRQFPGERATVDGRFSVIGSYAWYWGFEVMYSDPQRVSAIAGSAPTDLPRFGKAIGSKGQGSFNKYINLVVHDMSDGLGDNSSARGTEFYGNIIYNNGWIGPDRGHGHGMYIQNQFETKRIIDNVIFNSFSTGLKIGGTAASYELNFQIEGNSIFLAGAPALESFPYQANTQVQGGSNIGNITFDKNSFYHLDGNKISVWLGETGGEMAVSPVTVTNNYIQGSIQISIWQAVTYTGNKLVSGPVPFVNDGHRLMTVRVPTGVLKSAYRINNNSYSWQPTLVGPLHVRQDGVGTTYTTLAAWQAATGWDGSSLLTASTFTGFDIIVRPNRYEPGRATVTVWNWENAASVDVDVASLLKVGDKYTVHHVYDFFGPPVVEGTYSGGPISVTLREYTAPTPIGMTAAPPSTGSQFNVFIIRKS